MRIVIIGGVAAGTSAAAKARRNDEAAEIVIYDRDSFISYSGCGMPYYIGGAVAEPESLYPRDAAFFKEKYQIEVRVAHEVLRVDSVRKSLQVKDLATGRIFIDHYDTLVLATGAEAVRPPIAGSDGSQVFSLRNINDMYRIKRYLDATQPKRAVIVGSGFIGLEVCDNFIAQGLTVSLVERLPQAAPGLDPDMAVYVEEHLKKNRVAVYTGISAIRITKNEVILADGKCLPADLVILAVGVKPNVELAKAMGAALGKSGAIKVSPAMETSISDVYACGDCIETYQVVTGQPLYRPLGTTANKTGRITGDVITGGALRFRGILGTGIFQVLGLTVAQTGLSETEAVQAGYKVVVCHNIKPNKPDYMGGQEMVIKGVADQQTGRLLGAQIVGKEGVDKRIDVFATAITFDAKAADLFHLDLAYAPPFSTTKDPVMYTGMILDNALAQGRRLMTTQQLIQGQEKGEPLQIIDARVTEQYQADHVDGAISAPQAALRKELVKLNPKIKTVTYCNKGVTGNAAQNILLNNGFEEVYNLSGGIKQYRQIKKTR